MQSLAPAGATTMLGGIHVSTLPSGAEVWIDGTYIGRSPVLVAALQAGRHTLTVTKPGWVSQELPVDIPAHALATSTVSLTVSGSAAPRALGSYVVRKLPPDSQATVDGIPAVAGKETPAAVGTHRLTLTARGSSSDVVFTVYPDALTAIAFLDAALPAANPAIAPAADYLPSGAFTVSGGAFAVRYGGHEVTGLVGQQAVRLDGVTVSYDAAPVILGGRLCLPLALLEKLNPKGSKAK